MNMHYIFTDKQQQNMDEFRKRVKRELAKSGGAIHTHGFMRRARGGGGSDAATEARHAEYAAKVQAAKAAAARDGKDYASLLTADKAVYLRQAGALNEPVQYALPPVGVPIPTRDGGTRTLNADGTVTYQGSADDEAAAEQGRQAFQAQANQWEQDRVDEGRRLQQENESGFQKFARGAVSAATKVADLAASVPGVSQTLGTVYKAFAPQGSQYYHPGSFEDKANEAATNVALESASGGLLGGADEEAEKHDTRMRALATVMNHWYASSLNPETRQQLARKREEAQRTFYPRSPGSEDALRTAIENMVDNGIQATEGARLATSNKELRSSMPRHFRDRR